MSALVAWKAVEQMLDRCAPGWSVKLAPHFRRILAKGRVYPTFPKKDQIEVGHIRKMARHLGIEDCARNEIPAIGQ